MERRFELRLLFPRQVPPIDRGPDAAVGGDAYELARLIEDPTISVVIADLDGALDQQQPRHAAGLHVDIEDRATNRDRRGWGMDHVGRLSGDASDKAKGALG